MKNNKSVFWFYGLSGSGKSTLAHKFKQVLNNMTIPSYVLDGDNIRNGLCKDLTLSEKDRKENIRRAAEVSKLIADNNMVVLSAFITPYNHSRDIIKQIIEPINCYLIYVECPIEVCKERDPKRLYKNNTPEMTGITARFEEPLVYDLKINTAQNNLSKCLMNLLNFYLFR